MRHSSRVVLVAGAILWSAHPVRAQSAQPYSLQGSALYVGLAGDAYQGTKNGPGFEAQVRWNPGALSIGGGFQWSRHAVTEAGLQNQHVNLYGGFLEPRYILPVTSERIGPYLAARLAYLRQSLSIDTLGVHIEGHASGAQVNGGGGILVRLAPSVNLDLGVTVGYIRFGDFVVTASSGQRESGATGSGTNFVLRAGLAFGLGG